jgi:triosephosphate isomerase
VKYALIGHSERRNIFDERGRDIGRKVQAAIRNGIKPILCVGESTLERTDGETKDVLHDQLIGGLSNLTSDDMKDVLIAYEPVWAIGSGKSALPGDVKQAAEVIRDQVKHLFGAAVAKSMPILYGGSVSDDNASGYLATTGVNGLLIGGASLDVRTFARIIEIAHDQKK